MKVYWKYVERGITSPLSVENWGYGAVVKQSAE
jgi:hypothetical protein